MADTRPRGQSVPAAAGSSRSPWASLPRSQTLLAGGACYFVGPTRTEDRVFSRHLLAEKTNIQKYFDNDVLQFPEAV